MFGSGSATAAHDADTVVLHKMLVILGQLFRLQFVNRMTTHILRESGVGQYRNVLGGVRAQKTDGIVHFDRPGGAVQADDIHIERLERGERGADFCSQQHRPGGFERDLNRDREALASLLHGFEYAGQRSFGLEQVLRSLDQQNIDAAFDQRTDLLQIARNHVVKLNVSERRQLGSRPNRSSHKTRLVFRRKLPRNLFRNLRRGDVDLRNLVLQIVLGQYYRRSAESVGLHHIAAHPEEAGVNILNNVRPAQYQKFVASLLAPKIIHTGIAGLNTRPHGAVIDDNAFLHGL